MPLDEVIREGLRHRDGSTLDLAAELAAVRRRAERRRSSRRRVTVLSGGAAVLVLAGTVAVAVRAWSDSDTFVRAPATVPGPATSAVGVITAPVTATTIPTTDAAPPGSSVPLQTVNLPTGTTVTVERPTGIRGIMLESLTLAAGDPSVVELHFHLEGESAVDVAGLGPTEASMGDLDPYPYAANACPSGDCPNVGTVPPGGTFTLPITLLVTDQTPGSYRVPLALFPLAGGTEPGSAAILWIAELVLTVPEPSG
jgi:hypothetical protein